MDQFFQTLRKIQKKERNNGTLARVEDTFYQDIHKYLNNLKKSAGADPFSKEYNLIKDTQRVATEICERRESIKLLMLLLLIFTVLIIYSLVNLNLI